MRQFTITAGTELTKSGEAVNPTARKVARDITERALLDTFGGCTITEGQGAWSDGANTFREASITFLVLTDKNDAGREIKRIARTLRDALDQESVLIASHEVTAAFV